MKKVSGFVLAVAVGALCALPAFAAGNKEDASTGKTITTKSGLKYIDIAIGKGAPAVARKQVKVHYNGKLDNGKVFDSSFDRGEPIAFVLGVGQVIPGWDEGIMGMKVGGKRKLIIPPNLGYGAAGVPGTIPPNSTLHFDVELVDVQR